ncbi:hypothetical protein HWV62_429 [Athelia sp. TMB]|nr:hypothetical protein HWV62_429 [Athelia sp. TMB]
MPGMASALPLLLALAQTGAASNATTQPLTDTISIASLSSGACKDIDNCRTLADIVTSCVGTIFACVWVAVHRNLPGPMQSKTSVRLQATKVVVMTLVIPEWVMAWSVRQLLQARVYARALERVRRIAAREELQRREEGTGKSLAGGLGKGRVDIRVEDIYETQLHLPARRDLGSSAGEKAPADAEDQATSPLSPTSREDLMAPATEEEKSDAEAISWTLQHAFFLISGGFHFYLNGQPTYPCSFDDITELVRTCRLAAPTKEELKDKSKGDNLSKAIAIFQTLWFVAQCIARRAQNLAITNLEIMTLAYTVFTVAMYAAWWHKPLNIGCAIRVAGDRPRNTDRDGTSWAELLHHWRSPARDTLDRHKRVPTFWSSAYSHPGSRIPVQADIAALAVAMVFGAVHCAAWSYAFPTLKEKLIWRASAVVIAAIPVPIVFSFLVLNPLFGDVEQGFMSGPVTFIYLTLAAITYVPARILLLVLTFTTLRDLPPSAFQTVQWTTLIPHY